VGALGSRAFFLAGWPAFWSLIFCKFIAGVFRVVVGAVHPSCTAPGYGPVYKTPQDYRLVLYYTFIPSIPVRLQANCILLSSFFLFLQRSYCWRKKDFTVLLKFISTYSNKDTAAMAGLYPTSSFPATSYKFKTTVRL